MANYVTVSEADTYVSTHYLSTDPLRVSWEGLDDADKEILITVSTETINAVPWPGRKTVPGQPNAFPRCPNVTIPAAVISACVENALSMTDETFQEEAATYRKMWAYGLSSYSIGNFSETLVQGGGNGEAIALAQSGIVSTKAQALLKPLMGGGYCIE